MLILNRHPFSQFRREMDELFGSILADAPGLPASRTAPPMNVWEEAEHYVIEAELPGYRLEDIEVSVLGDEATLKGRRMITDPEGATMLRRERQAGSFSRTWTLPASIDPEKVEASLTHGVLRVNLPKTPQAQPRRIAVKSA